MKKIVHTVVMFILVIVLPLLGRRNLILTWPVLLVAVAGILLSLSQPPSHYEKKRDTQDQYSLHLILVAVLISFVVSIVDYAYGKPRLISLDQITSWLGIILIVGGLWFRHWSILVLGKFFTTKVQIQSDHELVQNGPYRYLRHPSYLGAWILMVGISIFLQSFWAGLVVILIYFPIYIYRITYEERALIQAFPTAYPEYQKKTWKMFPWVF